MATTPSSLFIVHSNPPNKWSRDLETGLEKSLSKEVWRNTKRYHFHNVYWLARSAEEQEQERKRILEIIAAAKPSAVLLCDDEANDFMARSLVAAGYPVYTMGVNRLPDLIPWKDLLTSQKVSGLLETWPVERALGLIEKHLPGKKRFSIVTSDTGTSARILEIIQAPAAKESMRKRGQVLRKVYRLNEWEGWKSAILEANKTDDLIWVLIAYGVFDNDNTEVTPDRMIEWLKANLKIPSIGSSVLHGGVSISIGVLAEQMAGDLGALIEENFQSKKPFGGYSPTDAYFVRLSLNKK